MAGLQGLIGKGFVIKLIVSEFKDVVSQLKQKVNFLKFLYMIYKSYINLLINIFKFY